MIESRRRSSAHKDQTTILIIDDESAIRQSYADYLEDLDYRTLTAENGRSGLEIFQREKVDLVLVDLHMPEVGGMELLARITETSPDIPLIVISGIDIIGDALEALHRGAWDYLPKPIKDFSILSHAVTNALEKAQLKIENRKYQEHLEHLITERTKDLQKTLEEQRKAIAKLRQTEEALQKSVDKEIAAKNKLQQLNVIGTQLAQIFDRRQVLALIFIALQEEAGILRSSLYLNHNNTLLLFDTLPEIEYDSPGQSSAQKTVQFDEGAIGMAAQEQKIVYLSNTQQNEDFPINTVKDISESLLCIPLLDGSVLVGVLTLTAPVSCLEETSQERMVAEALSGFLTISLKNMQLMEETHLTAQMEAELRTAAAVQHSLFPKVLPELPYLELASFYQSASDTGGDWYGVNAEIENTLYILIGDVTGHGTPAALVTASACATCHTLIQLYHDRGEIPTPTDILNYLNKTVAVIGAPNYLMTFFAARLDLLSGKLSYANAGHNFPIIIRSEADGSQQRTGLKEKHLLNTGYHLGYTPQMSYSEKSIQLEAGDLLFFYTDGLIEAENHEGKMWGERQLIRLLKNNIHLSAQEIVDKIVIQMKTFCNEQPLQDDVTIVSCQITQPFPQNGIPAKEME